MEKVLRSIYEDVSSPAGLGGVEPLYREARRRGLPVDRNAIRQWLAANVTYTLHKPAARKIKRNKVQVFYIDQTWQMDLVDVQSLAKHNQGSKYILTVIDLFSKFAFARPLKNKSGPVVLEAVKNIFEKSGREPDNVHSDQGTEFTQTELKRYLASRGIHIYSTFSEMKASVVERFNRTLKSKMWRYFTHSNSYKYLDVLQDLVASYNSSPHRSLGGVAPINVKEENQLEIWEAHHAQPPRTKPPRFKFNIGDIVRISRNKGVFEKGYTTNWSEEYFKVSRRLMRRPPTYRLRDLNGEELMGVFYEREMQKITPPDEHIVEKILRKRGNRYLVKWRGWPSSFNSWVDDLRRL